MEWDPINNLCCPWLIWDQLWSSFHPLSAVRKWRVVVVLIWDQLLGSSLPQSYDWKWGNVHGADVGWAVKRLFLIVYCLEIRSCPRCWFGISFEAALSYGPSHTNWDMRRGAGLFHLDKGELSMVLIKAGGHKQQLTRFLTYWACYYNTIWQLQCCK